MNIWRLSKHDSHEEHQFRPVFDKALSDVAGSHQARLPAKLPDALGVEIGRVDGDTVH